MAYPARPALVRLLEKADRSGGEDACWPWMASKLRGGYGCFRFHRPACQAHRAAYELMVGPIPDGLHVCHTCDNPACINPKHLFVGTSLDNMRDKVAKGRQPRGETHGKVKHPESCARAEKHGMSKVTWEQVKEMRRRYAAGGVTATALGKELGLTKSTACRILSGQYWKEPPEGINHPA